MKILSSELSDPRLFGDDESFAKVAESVAAAILSDKDAEFHSLGLTLGYDYEGSSIVATEPGRRDGFDDKTYIPTARPGHRLPHFWFGPGDSLFDHLGRGFSLIGDLSVPVAKSIMAAADQLALPLCGVDLGAGGRPDLFDVPLVLVRPDQHVAWRGEHTDNPIGLLQLAIGGNIDAQPWLSHTKGERR
jgi:hypothetical protein